MLRTDTIVANMTDAACPFRMCGRAGRAALLTLLSIFALGVSPVLAQHGLVVSNSADFSTRTHLFVEGETIHVKAEPRGEIDLSAVTTSTFTLDPAGGGESFAGALYLHGDASFTGRVEVAALTDGVAAWVLTVRVEDAFDHAFQARAGITIRRGGDHGSTFRIQGMIEAASAAEIVIGGRKIAVTANTEIQGHVTTAAGLEGLIVTVVVRPRADGSLVAMQIFVQRERPAEEEHRRRVQVEGAITSLSSQSITVEGVEFGVTAGTQVILGAGVAGSLGDLHRGMQVEMHGVAHTDGHVVASMIRVHVDAHATRMLRGTISSVAGENVEIGETSFRVTSETFIVSEQGALLSAGDLEAGTFAVVHLRANADGTLTAVRMKIVDRFRSDRLEVAGRIEAISEIEITVQGIAFAIHGSTEIVDGHGDPIDLAELGIGTIVRVSGEAGGNGTRVATEIRVRARLHHEGRFGGVVTGAVEGTIEVNGWSFTVTEQTVVAGAGSVGEIAIGQRVLIWYRVLGDGTRFALQIRVHAEADVATRISGVVDEIDGEAVVVAGVRFRATAATEVESAGPGLTIGSTVEVTATSLANELVATRIRVLESVVVSGSVLAQGETLLRVGGRDFELTNETVIVGRNNVARSQGDLTAGVFVEVLAVSGTAASKSGDAEMTAERVLVMEGSTTTAVDDDRASVPAVYTLEQNYPNPFNPTTTIEFEIGVDDAGHVSLAIYDLVGRSVRTLVDGSLPAGRHTYVWNGRDHTGKAVGSGLYVYRLQIGDRASTARTMTLIK